MSHKRGRSKSLIFIVTYGIFIAAIILIPSVKGQLFLEPVDIPLINWVGHFAAVMITTFYPGYAVLRLLDRKRALTGLSVLFSYIIGFSLTSMIMFVAASGGYTLQDGLKVILGLNFLLLATMVSLFVREKNLLCDNPVTEVSCPYRVCYCVILLSLLTTGLLALYCFVLGSQIIGDQRTHHGLALLFSSGFHTVDNLMMPQIHWFFHSYLSALFSLSSIPSVNVYNSLNILNVLPLVAFYLMARSLLKNRFSAVLSTFFAFFTSGFGWLYAMSISNTFTDPNVLNYNVWLKTYDVLTPMSFIIAGHPDITTPLQLTALIAGPLLFLLMFAPNMEKLGLTRYVLAFVVTFFAYMGHSEAALYIAVVLLTLPLLSNGWRLGASMTIALFAIYFVDIFAPGRYYTVYPAVSVAGVTTSVFSLLTSFSIAATLLSALAVRFRTKDLVMSALSKIPKKVWVNLIVIISSVTVFFYLLAYIVWESALPDFSTWLTFGIDGSVPWYVYPLKLGVVGIISLGGSIYLLVSHKRNLLKALAPFFLLAFLSYVLAPYYSEYRLIKHFYLALSVIAGFTLAASIQELMRKKIEIRFFTRRINRTTAIGGRKIVAVLLLCVIVFSIPSTLLFIQTQKYSTSEGVEPYYGGSSAYSVLPRRVPLTSEELQALAFIRFSINPLQDAVLALPHGQVNQYSEVVNFGGVWIVQANRYLPFFEVNEAENFFDLVEKIQPKYIYVNRMDRQKLFSDNKYSKSYLKEGLNFLSVAYNNSQATIFAVPPLAPPSSQSSVGVLADIPNSYLTAIALANVNYTLVTLEDYKRLGIDTLIIASYPDDTIFNELAQWVAEGNHLIIMDLPRTRSPVFDVINGYLSNVKNEQPNLIVSDNDDIFVRAQGSVIFDKKLESTYILRGEVKAEKPLDEDNHIGVIFNYQDANNYYYFFLRQNLAVLYEKSEGQGKEVWHTEFSRGEDAHIIEIVADPPIFRFTVDAKNLGEYTASMPLTKGFAGYKWHNLDGQLGELATLQVYESRIADELMGDSLEWDLEDIVVPYVQPSNLPVGSSVTAYYTKNNEKLSIFSFSTPNDKGQITYMSFSPLLKASNISGNLGRIFEVAGIDLPKRQSQQALPITEPINYVRGPVTLSGNVSIESPSIIVPSRDFYIKIGGKRVESNTAHSILDCPIESLSSTSATISPNSSGVYTFIDIFTPAALHLKKGSVTQIDGISIVNSTIELMSDTGVVRVKAKNPKFCTDGNVTFQEAYVSCGPDEVITAGHPAEISGLTEFSVANVDNAIIRLADFNFDGYVQVQHVEKHSNERDIKWDKILADSPHWLILAAMASIVVAKWVKKSQQNSIAGE